jgi:RNA polymerase sigma-B factor
MSGTAAPTTTATEQEVSAPLSSAEAPALPVVDDASAVAPQDARVMSKLFFDRLAVLEEGTHEYQYARNTLIELNLSLVHYAASRFRSRSEAQEDILQVGTIGLIKAIDRFDLTRGVEFTTFAIPYIVGEIKRFFRDTSWAVHVPRRLQELRINMARANEELESRLDRSPTARELAAHMGLTVEEIIEGQVAANGYVAHSLDLPSDDEGGSDSSVLLDRIGDCDPELEKVEDLHALGPLLEELDERDRRILQMRFGDEMTQSQIGAELGISQMHVSRLLSRCLARLRSEMVDS